MTSKSIGRSFTLGAFIVAMVSSPGAVAAESEPIVTSTFALQHRKASDAIDLIHPLLSERGAVELRPVDNTLVIRDLSETVEQALALLAEFDLPPPPLRFEIRIVRAALNGRDDGNQDAEGLPPALVERLRELLRYDSFELLSATELSAAESQQLQSWIGSEFQVRFRVGVVQADRRIKLHGFQVARRQQDRDPDMLIHTNLSLWLDKPMVLGLARTESSDQALMVVIHCTVVRSDKRTHSAAGVGD